MQSLVRNENEAWAALCALEHASDISALRFEGWPRLTISTSNAVDAVKESKAIIKIQEVVEKHYSLLKYGRLDRKRLTHRDSAEVRINVSRSDDGRKLIFDLSAAANAASRIISRRWENEKSGDGHSEEGWPRAVREVAGKVIEKVNPQQAMKLGFAAILMGGIAWASPTMWKDYLSHRLEIKKARAFSSAKNGGA